MMVPVPPCITFLPLYKEMTHSVSSKILMQRFLGAVSVLSISTVAFAYSELNLPNNEDLYFRGGVVVSGVEAPADLASDSGASSLELTGAGTITVANSKYNGFPRIGLRGGTRVTVNEYWASVPGEPQWWDGTLEAPFPRVNPTAYDVVFTDDTLADGGMDIVGAFQIGTGYQNWSFSPAADFAFRADVPNGTRLYVAARQPDNTWTTNAQSFCVVQSNICQMALSSMGSVALIKPVYTACPVTDVENGRVTDAPDCRLYCDTGFAPDAAHMACMAADNSSTESALEAELEAELLEGLQASTINEDAVGPQPGDEIPADVLAEFTGEDAAEAMEDPTHSAAMTRTQTIQQLTGELYNPPNSAKTIAGGEAPETPDVRSYGPRLTQSGPGPFLIIALFGLMLMLFGSTRRV